jgi:hypothetical protein
MLFAMLSFFGLCAVIVWESRIDARHDADVSAENIGQLFDGDIQRTFEEYDLLLQNVISHLRDPLMLVTLGRS